MDVKQPRRSKQILFQLEGLVDVEKSKVYSSSMYPKII